MTFLAVHERNLCCYQWLELIRNLVSRPSTVGGRHRRSPRSGAAMAPAGSLRPAAR